MRHHAHNGIDRHRKAYAGRGARRTVDGGIDSDQPPSRIEQRATGIAGVDGGVGLDQVIDGRAARFSRQRAVERGDDTSGERPVQAEGVADSEHLLTHLEVGTGADKNLADCQAKLARAANDDMVSISRRLRGDLDFFSLGWLNDAAGAAQESGKYIVMADQ